MLLSLVLTNKKGLAGNAKAMGSLGYSEQKDWGVQYSMKSSRTERKIMTMSFWRVTGLLRDLLRGIPWDRTLAKKEVQEYRSIFKHHFLQAQDPCIPLMANQAKQAGDLHG